jgi:hypothetical protein
MKRRKRGKKIKIKVHIKKKIGVGNSKKKSGAERIEHRAGRGK